MFENRRDIERSNAEDLYDRIADAISYAVKMWTVDIIALSFGFEEYIPSIEKAIKFAHSKGVITVAAASNSGGNSPIAWPARMDEVLCIFATDSLGNPCKFTPNPDNRSDNFGVLGEEVPSYWPPHLKQGLRVRKSGTSTATPIAAAIAAILLDFVRLSLYTEPQPFPDREMVILRRIRSIAGMRAVFRKMADKRNGYDYLTPWTLLNVDGYKNTTVLDIILQNLKQYT